MAYRLVRIENETIPGEDVKRVLAKRIATMIGGENV